MFHPFRISVKNSESEMELPIITPQGFLTLQTMSKRYSVNTGTLITHVDTNSSPHSSGEWMGRFYYLLIDLDSQSTSRSCPRPYSEYMYHDRVLNVV